MSLLPYDSTVTITEDTKKYVALPPGTMGYLEEKIRSSMWAPKIIPVLRADGMFGVNLLKQAVMTAQIRLEEFSKNYHTKYKAEVSFDMRPWKQSNGVIAPIPFLSPNDTPWDPRRRHSENPFPLSGAIKGDVRRPDVIIVINKDNRWPGRGTVDHDGKAQTANLERLVEVKFPNDDWGEGQESAYVAIAGDNKHMTLLEVSGGEERTQELRQNALEAWFLIFLSGSLLIRARVRPGPPLAPAPVPEPAYMEAWTALEHAGRTVREAVPALWDTANQGVHHLLKETQAWLHSEAAWLFTKGRWAADFTGKVWHYVDEKGHVLCQYTAAQFKAAWQQIKQQTDLVWDDLKKVEWGQILLKLSIGIAVILLVISGVGEVVALSYALVSTFFAMLSILPGTEGFALQHTVEA